MYFYTLTLAPSYKATAVLHVEPPGSSVFNLRELMLQRRDPAFQETQVGIILSRALIQQVVSEQELHKNPLILASRNQQSLLAHMIQSVKGLMEAPAPPVSEKQLVRATVEYLRKAISVKPRERSYLVQVDVTLPNAELAALVANSLAHAYIESVFDGEREAATRSEAWLMERLQTVRKDLERAEAELQRYKESENIIGSARQNDGLATQEIDLVSAKLIEARESRLALEAKYQQIISVEKQGGDLQVISAVESDLLVQNIQQELRQLQQRQVELSKRYGPEHRRMIELVSKITETDSGLTKQISRVIEGVKADYELAREAEIFLEESLGQSTNKAQSLGRKQFKLLDLEQSVKTQREVYTAFLERLNQKRATGENIDRNLSVTDPALPPLSPESNKGMLLVMLSIFVSAMAGLFIGLLQELFDNTMNNSHEVKEKLGVAAIGAVPLISELQPDEERPNVAYQYFVINKFSHFAEAIRSLRSAIMLSGLRGSKLRLMFTSTSPAEGKTSLALSVASAFSQVRKTLLIDADLRRPSLQNAITGTVNHHRLGLTDLCIGNAALEECIVHDEKLGVDVLLSGTTSPNPQELFCSTQFSQLINSLSELYDVVIFDSPPAAGLSDAHMLASQVDQLFYVVDAGKTQVAKARNTLDSLRASNAPLKGVVLNRTDLSESGGYGYQYYGSYGSEKLKENELESA